MKYDIYTVSKNAPMLASCSFDSHRVILISFGTQHQHTFTRNSPIADKLRDLFRGQSRSPNMVPLVSYVCYSNIVRKTHSFWDIRLQKCIDLENRFRGTWWSLKMSPFDTEPMTSYSCSIVTMALSCVVSEILNVVKCRDLEIQARGHWSSLKVAPFGRLCMVSY